MGPLDISKLPPGDIIAKKNYEENCSLSVFSVQTPEFSLFVLLDKSSSHIHNQLHAIASPNIWHYQMEYIGPLDLYNLGKECLRVKLQGKTISQCLYYTLSKISWQISQWSLINILTRLFHWIYVNLLDPKKGRDIYQDNKTIVSKTMVVVYKTKSITVTYFT